MPLAADYPFLDVLWTMLIFFMWVIWFWLLIAVFADIFRRHDIGGWSKALWLACIILVPFFGTLIYLIVRPAGATEQERVAIDQASREFVEKYTPTDGTSQLQVLADLHDRGKLTDEEFAAEKARLIGTGAPAAA